MPVALTLIVYVILIISYCFARYLAAAANRRDMNMLERLYQHYYAVATSPGTVAEKDGAHAMLRWITSIERDWADAPVSITGRVRFPAARLRLVQRIHSTAFSV